jgi:hypothetical protein
MLPALGGRGGEQIIGNVHVKLDNSNIPKDKV